MVNKDRSKFIYENGYGMSSDIYMLPVGTKFRVVNGAWDGEVIEENGKKLMWISGGSKVELKEDGDYNLVIRVDDEY